MNLQDALRLAIQHQNAGRLAEAEVIHRQILGAAPGHPVAATLLGRIALRRGDVGEAASLTRSAIDTTPDYPQAHATLGEALDASRDTEGAARAYVRALLLAPTQPGPCVALGNMAQLADDDRGAADRYRWALALRPEDQAANHNLAAAHLKLGEPTAALARIERTIAREPRHVRARAYEIVARQELGEWDRVAGLVRFGDLVRPIDLPVPDGWTDIDSFNRDLARALAGHPNAEHDPDPRTRAIRGGVAVPRLWESADPAIVAFGQAIRAAIDGYIADLAPEADHPYLSAIPGTSGRGGYNLDAWGNILGPGDHQSSHIHNLGWMSGVYYVAVPPSVRDDDPERAGWIEFNRPGYGIPYRGGAVLEAIRPRAGLAVFFPSYVWHRTIPFAENAERTSIAFDLHPTPVDAGGRDQP
jgi:tetratricopeptide (TPR) repeat protein